MLSLVTYEHCKMKKSDSMVVAPNGPVVEHLPRVQEVVDSIPSRVVPVGFVFRNNNSDSIC